MTQIRVVLSDLHIPFHSRRAVSLTLDAIEKLSPDVVDLLGDQCDFHGLSRFSRDPARKLVWADEIKQTNGFLDTLDQVTKRGTEIHWSDGNHEERLQRTVWDTAQFLAGMPEGTTPHYMKLKERGYIYHTYKQPYRVPRCDLWLHHGDCLSSVPGGTALAAMKKAGGSVLVGHSHRQAFVQQTTWSGTISGWENGCLSTLTPDWVTKPNWQNGFSIIRIKGRTYGVEQVQIKRGRLWMDGREFKPHKKRRR